MHGFLPLGWASSLSTLLPLGSWGQTPDPPALIDALGGRSVGITSLYIYEHIHVCVYISTADPLCSERIKLLSLFSPSKTEVGIRNAQIPKAIPACLGLT